ncbi:MAG: sialate O-acetylesterase [Planctomycetota bacterium]
MVLQRHRAVPLWGKAAPGSTINATFGEATATTTANAQGRWQLHIETGPASAIGRTLRISEIADGTAEPKTVEIQDVLVGEVWHASGQSNMRWTVRQSLNAQAEIAAADFPAIRVFTHPLVDAAEPRFTSGGAWEAASPDTAADFSAVAFFLARDLHRTLDVPVGVYVTPWGGAAAEAYVSPKSLADTPGGPEYVAFMQAAVDRLEADLATGEDIPDQDPRNIEARTQKRPSLLYHGMIHPVAPFAKRGVIWYQGEGNGDRADTYDALMRTLIEDWRTLWDQPGAARDFPFLAVQLANYRDPIEDPNAAGWGNVRNAQLQTALHHPHTYLATAIDVGEADDIHPANKQEVGRRLALIAKHRVYGDTSVVDRGPLFASATPLDPDAAGHARVRIALTDAAGLTTTDGQPPRGFAVRPADGGRWVWAENTAIDGTSVVVRAPADIQGPLDVRYAWGMNPADGPHGINLVNAAGLPAFPFTTAD